MSLPENTSIIIPRLVCRDPAFEVDFTVKAFEATRVEQTTAEECTRRWDEILEEGRAE